MSEPTNEYLIAKAELCSNLAIKQAEEENYDEAFKNIERAYSAIRRVFNMEEGGNDGNN